MIRLKTINRTNPNVEYSNNVCASFAFTLMGGSKEEAQAVEAYIGNIWDEALLKVNIAINTCLQTNFVETQKKSE
jgi:hypothetical protein